MSYDKIARANQLTIGTKQTLKMVENGKAVEVFIARDADPALTGKAVRLCDKAGVPYTFVDSMKILGKACGIEVGAAMAASIE